MIQPRTSKNMYGSQDALKDALWRTLMGNRDHQGKKITSKHRCLLECAPEEEQESRNITRGARTFNRFMMQSGDWQLAGHKLRSYFATVTSTEVRVYGSRRNECFASYEREGLW
jgi:hypothetical protein